MYLFVYSGLEFTITFVTHYSFGFDSAQQGRMLACMGAIMAVVQGGFVRRVKMGNEKKVTIAVSLLLFSGRNQQLVTSVSELQLSGSIRYLAPQTGSLSPLECVDSLHCSPQSVLQLG